MRPTARCPGSRGRCVAFGLALLERGRRAGHARAPGDWLPRARGPALGQGEPLLLLPQQRRRRPGALRGVEAVGGRSRPRRWPTRRPGFPGPRAGTRTAATGRSATSGWRACSSPRRWRRPSASGALKDRGPLERAAERLAEDQAADGSWPIEDGGGTVGSPASYGRPLATLAARDALRAADPAQLPRGRSRGPTPGCSPGRSTARSTRPSLLLAARRRAGPPTSRPCERLRAGQSADGGWGPYRDTPPEPFDSALALLALARLDATSETRAMIQRGRAFLVAGQSPDGSWPETTRPAGAESYAQRLSTTGWATLALLATRDRRTVATPSGPSPVVRSSRTRRPRTAGRCCCRRGLRASCRRARHSPRRSRVRRG